MSYNDSDRNCWNYDNKEDKKEEKCCCKKSMKDALKLLSDDSIKSDVNFYEFAFIGHKFLAGANIEEYALDNTNPDNINKPCAQFKGFDSCNCDLIKLNAYKVFYPIPKNNPEEAKLDGFDHVHYVSLCDIESIAFDYNPSCTTFETKLIELLDKSEQKCKIKCDDCCCNDGLFNKIYNPYNPINTVSLTGGWLAVKDVKVLGRVGNVLVLSAAPLRYRIYFVCLDSLGFIAY